MHSWPIQWYQSRHTLIRVNHFCVIHWLLFVMDRGQSLIIPPLFNDTNYVYWKVCRRDFLQSLDEKVWQAVEIGWTKCTEAPTEWMMLRSRRQTLTAGHWMLYSVQSLMRNSRKYPPLKLLSKHGPFSKQPMKEPRWSKIQSFRGSLQALKRSK